MMHTMSRSLFLWLALLLLAAASAASAPDASRVTKAPGLVAGEALVLAAGDGSGLVLAPADDPIIRFVEVEGAEVVVRLTTIDRRGGEIGSGRVIVVGAAEDRTVRLRDELAREALNGVELRVEVLQGAGRVMLTSIDANGYGLQPQADATPPRHRAVAPPLPTPTSVSLIDKAETSGALDGETALLYRVYALFSDARLPTQYRGDDSKIEDSLYMAEVRYRLATLSPATQAALLPFLTPPAYRGSWTTAAAGSSLTTLDNTPPPCQFFSDNWGSVDTSNNLVRVWYRLDIPDDARNARSLAGTIDATIWPKLSGLMTTGHLPLADLNERCNGGNGRLDIYLVDAPRSFTLPYTGCSHVPVFILLKRTEGNALAAHEIFHAFQFSFPLGGCIFDEKYHWWAEASAQWAQDFVFPSDQREQSAASSLLDVPEQPLDLSNDPHWYGAYLLPFFVYRKTRSADFVRASWENCASQPALEALDQALPGGFEAVWPEFVKYNWNRDPVENYKTWDGLTATAAEAGGTLGALPDAVNTLKLDLPRLSATYKHFYFDDSVRTIAFWNGVTSKLSLEARIQELGVQYQLDPASADEKRGARVQALIKIGNTWTTEDWTDRPFVTLCRDVLAERIDELVLIISNSEFKTRDRKLKPPALAPLLWVSNMGCWRWKGTATFTDDCGLTISTNVTWTRPAASLGPPFVYYQAEGTENWSSSGDCCNGSGALPILPELAKLFTYNFTPTQGSFHRSYWGAGVDNRDVTTICPGPPAISFQYGLAAWLFHPVQPIQPGLPFSRFLLVNANGRVMDDSFTIAGDEFKWHFEAQREP